MDDDHTGGIDEHRRTQYFRRPDRDAVDGALIDHFAADNVMLGIQQDDADKIGRALFERLHQTAQLLI